MIKLSETCRRLSSFIITMAELKLFEVGEEILENVAKSFGKTEESLNSEVKELIEWLETQPHLPEVTNEKLVQNFFIFNKCRIERTKQKLDNYYTVRSRYNDIFEHINPRLPKVKNFMEAVYYVPLPKLTADMYRVFILATRDKEVMDDLDPYDTLRYFVNMMEVRLHEDVTYGDIIVVDAKNISLRYLARVTPLYLYRYLVAIYSNVYSLRLKAVYVINAPKVLEVILNLIKKVVPKLANRIYIHKDPIIIHELISEEILPRDYGGKEKSLEELNELMKTKFDEYQERFDKLDQIRVDESLRPTK